MSKCRRLVTVGSVYLACIVIGVLPAAAGQSVLVDRLVLVIGEQALTWRDVEAGRLLGSIPAGGSDAEAIDRLASRELMRLEVDRLAVAMPIGAAVDERLERIRQRAGGPEGWSRALAALGLTEDRARAWVADDIRIDVYMDQRFTAAAQPTDVEVAEAASTGGAPPSPEALQDARRRLVEARRATLVADWVAGIRARTPVQVAGRR